MIKKNLLLIYARQRTSIIQNIPKANKKAQIKDKQAAKLTNHFALGLDPINSSCLQSKSRHGEWCLPVISNSAWPWRHPSLRYILALDMKTWELPKYTQHYYTWHESPWCSVILHLHQDCTSLSNSTYSSCQWLIRIQKKQRYSTQLWICPDGNCEDMRVYATLL